MRIDILSLFPDYFKSPFNESIIKRAQHAGYVEIVHTNIRDFAENKFHKVDDRPYGGGPGMVMMPEPVCCALNSVKRENSKVIYLTPQGKPLNAKMCRELASEEHLILLCGHYEGLDERVLEEVDEEVSIGDFVLTNGCIGAIVLVDAVVRLIPGVLGHKEASQQDSFENTIFDHPHYTKPLIFNEMRVPAVLQLGNHKEIEKWRYRKALEKTACHRFDLFLEHLDKLIEDIDLHKEKVYRLYAVENIKKNIKFYVKNLNAKVQCSGKRAVLLELYNVDLILVELPTLLLPWEIMMVTVNDQAFKLIKINLQKSGIEYAQIGAYVVFKDPDLVVWCIKIW